MYPYSELTKDTMYTAYTPGGSVDFIPLAIDEYNNHVTGMLLIDGKIDSKRVYVTGCYVYSSLAHGPHWCFYPDIERYLSDLQSGKISWQDYKAFTTMDCMIVP